MKSGLPPKKRDWQKGQAQVGIFVRSPAGSVVEVVADRATESEYAIAMELVKQLAKDEPDGAAPAPAPLSAGADTSRPGVYVRQPGKPAEYISVPVVASVDEALQHLMARQETTRLMLSEWPGAIGALCGRDVYAIRRRLEVIGPIEAVVGAVLEAAADPHRRELLAALLGGQALPLHDLVQRWRAEAAEYKLDGEQDLATIYTECAWQLEKVTNPAADEQRDTAGLKSDFQLTAAGLDALGRHDEAQQRRTEARERLGLTDDEQR